MAFFCGKSGIRTLGTLTSTSVFETDPIDHSGNFPFGCANVVHLPEIAKFFIRIYRIHLIRHSFKRASQFIITLSSIGYAYLPQLQLSLFLQAVTHIQLNFNTLSFAHQHHAHGLTGWLLENTTDFA